MIVVDATVWVDLLRGELDSEVRSAVLDDLCVSAPHVDVEVGSALIRAERRGLVADGAALRLVHAFVALPCRREYDPTDPVRALRYRDKATYADAWYLAMASRLSCPVATIDSGMATAAAVHDIEVVGL